MLSEGLSFVRCPKTDSLERLVHVVAWLLCVLMPPQCFDDYMMSSLETRLRL